MKNNITIIIKTFNRPICLERLLSSIEEYYPELKVLILNDGDKKFTSNNTNFRFINTEFDIGLSEGRNRLIEQVNTKYFLLLDDDTFFLNKETIPKMYEILENNSDIDLIAGCMSNTMKCCALIKEIDNENIEFYNGYKSYNEKYNYYVCDVVENFFLGRTDVFKSQNIKWDSELKMGEHSIFFYNMWKNFKLNIGYCPDIKIGHNHLTPDCNYSKMRHRAKDFILIGMKKYGLKTLKSFGKLWKI